MNVRRLASRARRAATARRRAKSISCALERLMRLPQLAVVDVVDRLPEAGLAAARRPVGPEMAVVDLVHLRRQPGLARGRRW